MQGLVNAMDKYNLDFDDAYQYVAAEHNDLIIVSFDSDLDKTVKGKQTPAEILAASKVGDAE
jgi:predicted nucleic acid-binding protein